MEADVTIKGLQEAQAKNARRIAALQPEGAQGVMVRDVTAELHRYAVAITHVWWYRGGGLRASHRMSVQELKSGPRGRIYISPTAVNPRGQKPAEYGPYEHARGGSHAFYDRTISEHGPKVSSQAVQFMKRSIERA